jgi:3-hydroxyisobutyrate dehydrogenase-like beta-hydroxyacid dehydrogenase
MSAKKVAIISPGDMGHSVGRTLGLHGIDVMTCLAGRSDRTWKLAAQGGFRDVPTLEAMVSEADLVLSIIPPAAALDTARQVAQAMVKEGKTPPYADCNAVSPETTKRIGKEITCIGGYYIDGGIIGLPPGRGQPTRFYVSGSRTDVIAELNGKGIDVRPIGSEIGRASAIKMCYAAITKGTNTLHTAVLVAAEEMGLSEELRDELLYSLEGVYKQMKARVPGLAVDAKRWIGEMNEIAATLKAAGVTPKFHEGAAEIFTLLASTPIASETRETLDKSRTLEEAVQIYVRHLSKG